MKTATPIVSSLVVSLIVVISPISSFAFKPTASHGHAGITKEGLSAVERTAASGESLRFTEEAILEVREANAGVDKGIIFKDAGEFDDPVAHCDDELLVKCSTRIRRIRDNIISILSNGSTRNGEAARKELGRALHTLQDFYSHSNWVNSPGPNNSSFNQQLGKEIIFPVLSSSDTCVDDTSDGTLTGAGLNGLTTGYFAITLPQGFEPPPGKCAHGVLPGAGIHKDTPSRPHHSTARVQAVNATTNLVEQILEANGVKGNDDAIRSLMGIRGSVGFAIDNTGSMGPEISGVASSVSQIINTLSTSDKKPDNYVLVGFGDPNVGGAFKTTSPDALLSAVNSITPSGGGDCPELSQGGLLRALEAADTGSTVYLYTDATAKDSSLVGNVIATATSKSIKLNYVISGSCSPIDPVYYAGAQNTGGQTFVISENETNKVFDLIEPSLTASLDSIELIDDQLSNELSSYSIPIDPSIGTLLISVSAESLTSLEVKAPAGSPLDVSTPGVSITNVTNGRIIKVDSPTAGNWVIDVLANGKLSLSVKGDTSIRLADFDYIEETGRAEHEGFFPIKGQPIVGKSTLSRAVVTGAVGEGVKISRRKPNGEFINDLPLSSADDEDPSDTFVFSQNIDTLVHRIAFTAPGPNGTIIQRVHEPILKGQSIEITSVADTAILSAGDTASMEFLVSNHGETGSFQLRMTDTQGFLLSASSNILQINGGESKTVSVSIGIPENTDAESTTVSLHVSNISDPDSYNSATIAIEIEHEPEFKPKVLALESLTLSDRAKITFAEGESIFVGESLVMRHDTAITGELIVDGTVTLLDRAVIEGDLSYSGTLQLGHGAIVQGDSILGNVEIPEVEGKSISVGSEDIVAIRDSVTTLTPGSYKNCIVEERAILNLQSGEYNFNSLDIRHGAKIHIVDNDGEVVLNAQGPISVGNMSTIDQNDSQRITAYSNTDQQIYIGHDSTFEGTLIAPHGSVKLATRAKAKYIEARHILLDSDSEITTD